jgi:hypothetical protein
VNWGYKRVRDGLAVATLPLSTIPSVAAALAQGQPLVHGARSRKQAAEGSEPPPAFSDWEAAQLAYGASTFLVVPLALAGRSLGALCLSLAPGAAAQRCCDPLGEAADDAGVAGCGGGSVSELVQVASEYGAVLSQFLYTAAIHQEKQAGAKACLLHCTDSLALCSLATRVCGHSLKSLAC